MSTLLVAETPNGLLIAKDLSEMSGVGLHTARNRIKKYNAGKISYEKLVEKFNVDGYGKKKRIVTETAEGVKFDTVLLMKKAGISRYCALKRIKQHISGEITDDMLFVQSRGSANVVIDGETWTTAKLAELTGLDKRYCYNKRIYPYSKGKISKKDFFAQEKKGSKHNPPVAVCENGEEYSVARIMEVTGLSRPGAWLRQRNHIDGVISDEQLLKNGKLERYAGVPFEEFFVMIDGKKVFASEVALVTGCANDVARERLRRYRDGVSSKKYVWSINEDDDKSGDIEFSDSLIKYMQMSLKERIASDEARESRLNDIPELTELEKRYL